MVKLNKIYTRTGDDGTTGLGAGERRSKADARLEAVGTVDEANACIGLARLHTAKTHPEIDAMLARIQNDLFDLGADLATPDDGKPLGYEPLRIVASQTLNAWKPTSIHSTRSSSRCAPSSCPADLRQRRRCILPARSRGAPSGCMVALAAKPGEHVNPEGLKYINRVSDLLFVAGRAVNDNGNADVLWVPGKNR